jgi:hypothetical protein
MRYIAILKDVKDHLNEPQALTSLKEGWSLVSASVLQQSGALMPIKVLLIFQESEKKK